MQIDIDHVNDYSNVLNNILLDSYTYVAFQSPGGKGIKVIVKINPDKTTHLEQFYALEEYYKKEFNVEIDPSCKDVARCLLLSYDPNIFCNPFSDVFEECVILEPKEVKKSTNYFPKTNVYLSNKENPLKELTEAIEKERVDITNTYDKWMKVGFAISETMGENGREYFHRISQFHPDYKQEATDKLYNSVSNRNNGSITIGTLFFLAKERGIFVNFKNETDLTSMAAEPASPYGNDLYERLKKFRQRKSQEKEMSLFYIFNNASLEELVKARPKNIKELEKIKGIGKKKIEWFGKELLEEIQLVK
jgi:superfamily II DNA helicase RecQ